MWGWGRSGEKEEKGGGEGKEEDDISWFGFHTGVQAETGNECAKREIEVYK